MVIEFTSQEEFEVKGRGTVYMTLLGRDFEGRHEMNDFLLGKAAKISLPDSIVTGTINGVESFAHGKRFFADEKIGIMLKETTHAKKT